MDPTNVTIRLCNSTKNEIKSIKLLQNENLKCNLSANDISQDGFVTAIYDHDFLHLMNSVEPSIVAVDSYVDVDEPVVVGYSLVITRETIFQGNHQLLADLFRNIDAIKDGYYSAYNYVVVGQICIKKGYRTSYNIFQRMYHLYKEVYNAKYSHCITEIAKDNQRSLRAHTKVGFKIADTSVFNGTEFYIVVWDWTT